MLQKARTGEWTPPVGLNQPAVLCLKNLRERMSKRARVVNDLSEATQRSYAQRYKLRFRPREFDVGDPVLFLDPGQANKMQLKWRGPAVIKGRKRPESYAVEFPGQNGRLVHANKQRPYLVRIDNVGVMSETDNEFRDVESSPLGGAENVKGR